MLEILTKPPFVCVNCGHDDNQSLYREYGNKVFQNQHNRSPSTAGSNNLFSNNQNKTHRLTECEKCSKPVDEYVQLDYNILFLDAILQKMSLYRHILLNCQINSRNALKLAIIFGLCEAFQRWTQLNGAGVSDISCQTDIGNSRKTYYELEISFYITFILVIIENTFFNFVFFVLFRCFAYLKSGQWRTGIARVTFLELYFALTLCNFGKLFLIPSYLYACELKSIVDTLITIFWMFSIVRCAQVKGHRFLNRLNAFCLVAISMVFHSLFERFVLRSLFHQLTSLVISSESSPPTFEHSTHDKSMVIVHPQEYTITDNL